MEEPFDFEAFSETELRNNIARGDYFDVSQQNLAKKALRVKERERIFQEDCERASKSAALIATRNATRANYIALAALFMSTISAREQLMIVFSTIKAFIAK